MLMKMRSRMSKHNNQKGFTLVELMVVVVIIGILVAIAVPVYNSVTEKAELSAMEANLRTIDGAIMMYAANNDGAAATQALLMTDGAEYLKEWPTSPGSYSIVDGVATVTLTAAAGGKAAGSYTLSDL